MITRQYCNRVQLSEMSSVDSVPLNHACHWSSEEQNGSSPSEILLNSRCACTHWGACCGAYSLRGPWLGLRTVLQSFHQASTACLGENLPREGPSSWISKRSPSVSWWSLVLRSILTSLDIHSTLPFENRRLKHSSQRTRTFDRLVASGET